MFDLQSWVPPTEQGYYDDRDWWVDTTPDPWVGTDERDLKLPQAISTLPPGAELAEASSRVDRSRLSGFDLIALIQAQQRLVSHCQAELYRSIAELASFPQLSEEGLAPSEIAAALHLTRTSADNEYAFAMELAEHPALLEELGAGRLDIRRVRVVLDQVGPMAKEAAEEVVARVLPGAAELTTGQLRARAKRIAVSTNPQQAQASYERSLSDRRVVLQANPQGTANLALFDCCPTELSLAYSRLDQLAREAKTPGDIRTIDQLRADTLLDILNGRVSPSQPSAAITVVVELETLAGLADHPGDLAGYGPVVAEIARKTASSNLRGGWDFVVRDQGQPVATGTLSRRPTAAMKRRIRAQYPTCVHPGCRRPARQADIDHTVEWADAGETRLGNLAPLCEYHHGLKSMGDHSKGWSYRIRDGEIVWTSPLGHTYITNGQSP